MRKTLYEFFSWMPFYFLLAPTLLVMVSWNSLPGDIVYPVKLLLEDVAIVFISPSDTAKGTLSVKYAERRFSEATTLLATKHSVQGFEYLDRQVVNTKTVIQSSKNTKTKSELAQTYLITLHAMNTQLEEQKQVIANPIIKPSVSKTLSPTPSFTPFPTKAGTRSTSQTAPKTSTPTSTPTPTRGPTLTPVPTTPGPTGVVDFVDTEDQQEQILDEISETQEKIQEAIEAMETVVQSAPPVAPGAVELSVPASQTSPGTKVEPLEKKKEKEKEDRSGKRSFNSGDQLAVPQSLQQAPQPIIEATPLPPSPTPQPTSAPTESPAVEHEEE